MSYSLLVVGSGNQRSNNMNDVIQYQFENYQYRQGFLDAQEGLPAIEPADHFYMAGYDCGLANDNS